MPNTTIAAPTNKLNLAYLLANPKELYQVKQIADVFHKHPETIRRWIKTDKIIKPLSRQLRTGTRLSSDTEHWPLLMLN